MPHRENELRRQIAMLEDYLCYSARCWKIMLVGWLLLMGLQLYSIWLPCP